jgi:hypothetical protein
MREAPPWRVLPNGPLEKLEDNLWEVEGTIPGMPLNRRMTLVRLADGSIVVHNAICLKEEEQAEIERWGRIGYIIVPNGFHRIDAARYAARYPDAKVLCPDPARKAASKVVRIDGNLTEIPMDPGLSVEKLAGESIEEAVLIARSGSGRTSLVFNDSLMNLPRYPGFKGWLYQALGSTGAPKVTPLIKLYGVKDKAALRAHLERLAALPGLVRAIPGHGAVVEGAGTADVMRGVAAAV